MPSLADIRRFNQSLVALGDEPSVVQSWGEDLEEVEAPEEGLDADLTELLGEEPADEGSIPSLDELSEPPEPPDDDFLSSLTEDALADEEEGPGEAEPVSEDEALGEPESFDEDASLEDLFGDAFADAGEPEAEPEPEPEPEPEAEPDFTVSDEDFGAGEELGPDEFDADAFDLEGFGGDIPDFDEADEPEELGEPERGPEPELEDDLAAEPAPEEDLDDAFGLDDSAFAGADLGDLDTAEPSDEDDLGLPEEGFSFDDESGVFEENGFDLGDAGEDLEGFEFTDEEPGGEAQPGEEADELSFDMPGGEEPTDDMFGAGEPGAEQFAEPSADFSLDDAADVEDVGEDDLDEFSLGDFGAEFGVLEEAESTDEDLNPAINVPEVSPGVPIADGGVELSDADFAKLQSTLAGYPLNLKLEVEQFIAEDKGNAAETERIIRMLVAGDSAQAMAQALGKILGKRIRIPRGYEKRSGEEFEAERGSFAYQLHEHILPALRVAAVVAVALGVVGLMAYHLIYRPIRANNLYREGLAYVDEQQYQLGNQTFAAAREVWPADRWFYSYAEQFIEERQYRLAQEKYGQLLFGMTEEELQVAHALLRDGEYAILVRRNEPPKEGILDYAELESDVLANYAKADRVLRLLLVDNPYDYEAWLARGDNYLRWGEVQPERLEDARQAYARLIQRYGDTDELLFRMLAYFMRVDDLDQVLVLAEIFQASPETQIETQIYADLAGYLIDKGRMGQVEDILFRTMDEAPDLPDVHYHLARYYREVNEPGEERIALSNAQELLEFSQPLGAKRLRMLIDTHIRIGENHYGSDRYLDAQGQFERAIELYDTSRNRDLLGPDPVLARAYARLGDVDYYVARDYDPALQRFDQAEALGYRSPEMDYKQGFVLYRNNDYNAALQEFLQAEAELSSNGNVLYSIANTHFRRRNFYAAEAYYREVLNDVERRRSRIRTLLLEEDTEHRSVIEYLIKVRNNLGVTLYRLSVEQADQAKFSDALVYLTESTETAGNYRRDPETLARSAAADLAFVNQRELVYPRDEYEPQIYADLPMDPYDQVF